MIPRYDLFPQASASGMASSSSISTRAQSGSLGRGSTLSEEELSIIRARFFPESGFELELPEPARGAAEAPAECLAMFEETLLAGLRFPLPEFVVRLLKDYEIVPAQLVPNSWRQIIGFLSLCALHELPSSLKIFRSLYSLKRHPQEKGWWYFSGRGGHQLFRGMPSSIHGWKNRHFLVRSDRPWGFNPIWGDPRLSENKIPSLSTEEEGIRVSLQSCGTKKIAELISEDALRNAGLSHSLSPGGFKVFSIAFSFVWRR